MAATSLQRLPVGCRSRPATTADVTAVHRLVTACEVDLHGRATTGADRVAADLGALATDARSDAVLVYASGGEVAPSGGVAASRGEVVGWGWVRGRRATVHVHPGHRGRGLGGLLLAWTEERARQWGGDRLAQTVPDEDHAAVALLESGGYARLVTEWLLAIATPTEPHVPDPPAGITVRAFRAGDEQSAYRLTEDAFDEWQQRRKSYAEWARHTVERPTFAPAASTVALAGEQLVGAVLSLDIPGDDEGYVERVAVRRDFRNRGIARVLLQESFRAFHRQGKRGCTLWTHSDTGALPLYERIGMTVRRTSTVYSKTLTAG
ncbi:GNAT family N-acetyltransferase [Streptomyces griseorubiginosus]|uniref:GNAT family N-acetyltransferase n=1 Tax=Streptomyces griseorubiginosus TaxID=67304 RepID=UPI002E8012AC|nr:GNAT family N-acetyltransferase [Streptomyces griseorubiginosus]WUB49610.1 GNAT family N-acetyltransferase [Streptomyces griseorubiginosus]WUB58139.1 GNAT family N-acetyltransferase [Streptomyces griseorubiginosus]